MLSINREEEIFVTIELINLPLVSKESTREVRKNGKRLVYLGLIVIAVKRLVRKNLCTKVLISLLDNGWRINAKNELVVAIEVGKSENKIIFYRSPDFSVRVKDLELLEIGIQTRVYEDLVNRSNLLVNISFIGKFTGTSITKYKLNIDGIISGISSKGLK